MPSFIPAPLLAAGGGELITIIMIAIGFISWLVQNVGNQNRPAQPPVRRPGRPPRPRNQPAASEIEDFLEEVQPGRPPQPQPRQSRPQPQGKPRPQGGQIGQKQKPRVPAQEPRRLRPGEELAHRHVDAKDLGSGVRKHVSQHVPKDAVGKQVERDLEHRIDREVTQHLGKSSSSSSTPPPAVPALATEVRDLLARPENMRQAIVLNEILTRPKFPRVRRGR